MSDCSPSSRPLPFDATTLLAAVVENTQDAVIAHSPLGVVLSWNRGAERIYGYSAEEVIGREIRIIVPPEKVGELTALYGRIKAGENVGWIETGRVTKDGRRLEISLCLSAIYDRRGALIGFSSIARDVTERNKAIAEDRRRQKLLTDFVENATEGLHWVGPDGTILWANRAELETLGYSAEEYIGHNIVEFHVDEPVICDILQRLTAGEKLHGYEARMRCKDGSIRHVLINSSVYFEDGKFVHTRCFTRDITARRLAQEALEAAQQKLREHAEDLERQVAARTADLRHSVQSLEGLCYTMAHDLRSPLRSLQNFAEILRSDHAGQLDADGRLYADRILKTAARMDELIRDLLEFARVSHTDIATSEVDLNDRAAIWEQQFADEFKARGAQLIVRRPLPRVLGNRVLLDQVFSNLLANAVKFTSPSSAPVVEISGQVEAEEVKLRVRDNGIGIPEDQLESVFGLFQRLHSPREYPGTGVGLAIVRKAVERMGGSIQVTSRLGEGSCFCLQLPGPARTESALRQFSSKA